MKSSGECCGKDRHVSRHGASDKEVRFRNLICENLRNLWKKIPPVSFFDFIPNLNPPECFYP
jgi:hypothetical protein